MLILRLCRIFAFHNLQNHLKPHNMICNYSITRHIDKELCNNNGTVEDRTGHINSIVGMHDQIYKIGANKKKWATNDLRSFVSRHSPVKQTLNSLNIN